MTSLNSSVGSKRTDLSLPGDDAFSSGGSSGAVRSSWISRLRPPPSSRHAPLPAESDPTDTKAQSSEGTVSTRESRTRPRSRSDDLDGAPFLVRRYLRLLPTNPTPPPRSSSRLLRRETPGAAASSSHHQPLQQSQRREEKQRQQQVPQADLGHRRGAEAAHEEAAATREGTRGRRDCQVAGFGPFQLSWKRARLPLGQGHKQQQEQYSQWKSEGERDHGGGCGTAPAGVAEQGSYKPCLGDGCFPIFRRIVGFSPIREEAGKAEEKDRKEELQAEMREGEHLDETGDQDYS